MLTIIIFLPSFIEIRQFWGARLIPAFLGFHDFLNSYLR